MAMKYVGKILIMVKVSNNFASNIQLFHFFEVPSLQGLMFAAVRQILNTAQKPSIIKMLQFFCYIRPFRQKKF